MPDRIGVGSRIALVVVLLTLFYVRLQPDFANEKHLSHLPMYQHTGEDERMTSASAPEVDLHIRQWPVSEAKGVIILVHGYAEHIDRYEAVAQYLNQLQYSVYGLSHQGHGKSGGDRAHVRAFPDYATDVLAFTTFMDTKHPEEATLPHYLLAHSMGSVVGLKAVEAAPSRFKAIALSAPAISDLPDPLYWVSKGLAAIGTKLPMIGYSLDLEGLSSNPEERAQYLEDPLVFHGSMRVGWGASIIETIRGLRSKASSITIPTLILQGDDDTITPLSGAEEFFALLPEEKKKLNVYGTLRHEILRESSSQAILDDIVDWFELHSGNQITTE